MTLEPWNQKGSCASRQFSEKIVFGSHFLAFAFVGSGAKGKGKSNKNAC
jgi:hypothetical protein